MMIRCLTAARHVAHHAGHKLGGHIIRHPGAALALVWAPCALVGAGGLALVNHWPALQAAVEPITVPEPAMIFTWIAFGVYIILRRK